MKKTPTYCSRIPQKPSRRHSHWQLMKGHIPTFCTQYLSDLVSFFRELFFARWNSFILKELHHLQNVTATFWLYFFLGLRTDPLAQGVSQQKEWPQLSSTQSVINWPQTQVYLSSTNSLCSVTSPWTVMLRYWCWVIMCSRCARDRLEG